jgi:hemerythrin-like domain-containing protein
MLAHMEEHGTPDPPATERHPEHARAHRELARFERECTQDPPARDCLETLVVYLRGPFEDHMCFEEQELYPRAEAGRPERGAVIASLRADHAEVRALVTAIAACLEEPEGWTVSARIAVLAHDLRDLLALHLEREERTVLAWVSEAGPDRSSRGP